MTDVIILGGGISGLSVAYYLMKAGKAVVVLEKANRPGGLISSEKLDGRMLEYGPNSLRRDSNELEELITDLGLHTEIVTPAILKPANFIALGGKLVKVPRSPFKLITSKLLSGSGKRRLLKEPFLRSAPETDDESVAAFFRRRLGDECVEILIKPMMSGIYAGDAEQLSMQSAFPKLWYLERTYGSIVRGMLKEKRKQKPNLPKMFSFKHGLSTLPYALQSFLGPSLQLNQEVSSIEKQGENWVVKTISGQLFESPKIVCTTPLAHTISVLPGRIGSEIKNIYSPPIAIVHLGYQKSSFRMTSNGFGFLVPPSERSDILGCIFVSSIYPDRAPEGESLFTVLLGGATRPDITMMAQEDIEAIAHNSLKKYLQPADGPSFTASRVLRHSIPQYNIGHSTLINSLTHIESENVGLFFAGNYRGGISIGSCITFSKETAIKILGQ